MQLERLEHRQLLAVGPQIVGIQPNSGELLEDGQVRNVAPLDLTFLFDEGATIDPTTLDAIKVTRSGFDGAFDRASVFSDFNTGGLVVLQFIAANAGPGGNGITIDVSKGDTGPTRQPAISVTGETINVTLNTRAGLQTRAIDLVTAINGNPESAPLVTASVQQGNGATDITTPTINYSPLILGQYNTATATIDFNISTLEVLLAASSSGISQNGITVEVTKRDFGQVAPPTVDVDGTTVRVELNTFQQLFPALDGRTTAQEFVDAINNDADASALVTASIPVGDPTQIIATSASSLTTALLTGANDVEITPGAVLLGDSPREVIFRFAEALPDDIYRIDVLGAGAGPVLRNLQGVAVGDVTDDGIDDGADFSLQFELDLGANVVAVVPQPVVRDASGAISQRRNIIEVYFNNDDLHGSSVETGDLPIDPTVVTPTFYQLIFTNDTATNADDLVFIPTTVRYNPATDRAELEFEDALDQLDGVGGSGTFRLRIGTDEAAPLAPINAVAGPALPSGPTVGAEIPNPIDPTIIDNDIAPGEIGQFAFDVANGGSSGSAVFGGGGGGVTAQGIANLFQNQNFIFQFFNFIDVGSNGGAINLGNTVTTTPAQLVSDDLVVSEGFFFGDTGQQINWRVESTIDDGDFTVRNEVTFTVNNPADNLGNLRFINYLDEDVLDFEDDILHLVGTPGAPDFRAFTLDGAERIGFSQGGIYTPGPGLVAATYDGFAADAFNQLQTAIVGSGTTYSVAGNIDLLDLPETFDPLLGTNVFGPEDVTTAFAWTVNPIAPTATITTFLELVPEDPSLSRPTPDFEETGSTFDDAIDLNDASATLLAWDSGQIIVVEGDGSHFADGQRIVITDDLGVTRTFEFDDAAGTPGVGTGNIPILFSSSTPTSQAGMLTAIAGAINGAPAFNVAATIDGNLIKLANDIQINIDASIAGMSLTTQGIVLSSEIEAQDYGMEFPGANDEPGARELRAELDNHLSIDGNTDLNNGIETFFYNFQDVYGSAPNAVPGQPRITLFNLITETQKQRAREIFDFYSELIGVQFVESPNLGFTIATGDLRFDPQLDNVPTGPGGVTGIAFAGTAVMDNADNNGPGDDLLGAGWFQTAMHEIGHLLGLGHSYELPPITVQGDEPLLTFGNTLEPDFPGNHDIVHGQHQHRPESKDIDLYRFQVTETGLFTAEIFAERRVDEGRQNDRLLDSRLALYRTNEDGVRELIAQNDDYFSNDSFVELALSPGEYFVAVSASGNDKYDPNVPDSGIGGTSQGPYDLRLNFRPDADNTIVDATGVALDGDVDGVPGGVYDFWFRTATPLGPGESASSTARGPRTIFVDRAAPNGGNGSASSPLNNIANSNNVSNALGLAQPGDVVRIVGNPGGDGDFATLDDNLAYEIGFNGLGARLRDGLTMDVPERVTVMIDSNAIIKLRRARIGVGSSEQSVTRDRSGGTIQVLGVPNLLEDDGTGTLQIVTDIAGRPVPGSVYLTSIYDAETGLDTNPESDPPDAEAGNWGGISIRNDIDRSDGRFDWEEHGVFLNYVNNANIKYGGGVVVVNSKQEVIRPINMVDARPTASFNTITLSADAAMSANPNAFEETNFHSPRYQAAPFSSFTSDYTRVGPEIHRNTVVGNTINGLLISIDTLAGDKLEKLTVSGRIDDTDIVHVLKENLTIQGTPAGPITEFNRPQVQLVTLNALVGGSLAPGSYEYRVVFVDRFGTEGVVSDATASVAVGGGLGSIRLRNLPTASGDFVSRRLYRSSDGGTTYQLVAQLNSTDQEYVDDGVADESFVGGPLNLVSENVRDRMRPDGSLVVDPGTTVKLEGAKVETTFGAHLIAEGLDGREVIFTSVLDDRYGAGGTFDTSSDLDQNQPGPGEWAGFFIGHLTSASFDHAVVAYAGGVSRVEGNFTAFNALEIHQAEARVAHSVFEFNANGRGGQAPSNRFGRGFNEDAVIFVRGSQPVIIENVVRNNLGPAISINANSLDHKFITDDGRATGAIDRLRGFRDNQGPLVRGNRLGNNTVNGMVVRGETIDTQGVWDDTDIVHTVFDEIVVPDVHTYGGLRLESTSSESLVVKLSGANAGFTATGRPLDIEDRIGGSLQIIGQPNAPVVLTSFADDTVGAGFRPDGSPQNDTNNDGSIIGDFDIDVVFPDNSLTPSQQAVFTQAAARWEQIIVGDLPDVVDPLLGTIDDVVITATAPAIDGAGGILGQAGPTGVRTGSFLPFAGDMQFDSADLAALEAAGQLVDVILHEMSHVLGFGTIWTSLGLLQNGGSADPRFIGAAATSEYNSVFGLADPSVPVANTGGPGTRDSHWRESVFTTELMTGFLNSGVPNPISRVTIGAYQDMGYAVNFAAADPFNPFFAAVQAAESEPGPLSNGMILATNDFEVRDPIGFDPNAASANLSLVPTPTASSGIPGDWRSIRIDQFGNDRNVDVVVELESRTAVSPGDNSDPSNAEFIGALAPTEKDGDDTLRLGFEVHGLLNSPTDLDVYSFDASGQTEIWIDIDRSTHALDTVVEVVDGFGNVIARSDNSFAESLGAESLFQTPFIPSTDLDVNILQKDAFTVGQPRDRADLYGTNPRDAGMRVVLPGAADERSQYFVRVRSNGDDLDNLAGGISSGAYQLQVRLNETDELPGSTIRFADIRFATNGVEAFGQPSHSPLAGEATEDSTVNDTLANAQQLGNLLNTDLATLSIAGNLANANDVDFYQFDVTYDSIQQIGGFNNSNIHQTVIFDLDYADGLARANTVLSVFDATGNLVFSSLDSNIADDQPGPLEGSDVDDLSRGSAGTQDAFIGPVELPVGTYFVAVSSNAQIPAELGQSILANPANTLHRLEPVNSLVRIAEDRISFDGGSNIPASPLVPNLLSSEVPWFLGDVTLLVSQDPGLNNQTNVYAVDPFTGVLENVVGRFAEDVGDIAVRHNGNVHGFTHDLEDNQQTDAESGNYLQINTTNTPNLSFTNLGDDGIVTFEFDPANPGNAVVAHIVGGGNRVGWGIQFDALTYDLGAINQTQRGFAIGNRGPLGIALSNGVTDTSNVLYQFNPDTGVAFSATAPDRTGNARAGGAGTQIRERGVIDTNFDPFPGAPTAIQAIEATTVTGPGIAGTIFNIQDGMQFVLDDGLAQQATFEFNSGPELNFIYEPPTGAFIRDGQTFELDLDSTDGNPPIIFEFNTGQVLEVRALSGDPADPNPVADGDTFTLRDDVGQQLTFEFDKGINLPVPVGRVAVPVQDTSSQAAIIAAIVNAINQQNQLGFGVTAVNLGNRISLISPNNQNSIQLVNSLGVAAVGDQGLTTLGSIGINIEETMTSGQFINSMNFTFNVSGNVPAITMGFDGTRVNFLGADTLNLATATPVNPLVFTQVAGSDGMLSDPTFFEVPFLAQDLATDIAQAMVNAINANGLAPAFSIRAGQVVQLQTPGATFVSVDPPLTIGGAAPGGDITGLTFVGSQMYGVTDTGGLFRILNPLSNGGAIGDFIETGTDLRNIDFQGLTVGPANVEGGRFASTLFGIDGNGVMYAFDTAGRFEPIFADGRSDVQINLPISGGVHGIAFSNLDHNLWHSTPQRNGDAGHQLNPAPDDSRIPAPNGGNSLYFGFETPARNGVPGGRLDPGNRNDLNFVGGAAGAFETESFSLEGYSPADKPVAYVSYFLETENANFDLNTPTLMRDAFRVYASGEDGQWHLVETNNSDRGAGTRDDEFDDPFFETGRNGNIVANVQEAFDNSNVWRQLRIPLEPFAGQSDVRFRFEFSTAASFDMGNSNTGGSDLRAVDGADLRDGETFTIFDNAFGPVTFEFDLGYTLVAPDGAQINDGDTFTIDSLVFEFEDETLSNGVAGDNIAISFNDTQSPATVAQNIAAALSSGAVLDDLSESPVVQNDTIATAFDSRLSGGFGRFQANGEIGDNPTVVPAGLDVDLVEVFLNAGDTIVANVSTFGSSLDSVLRLFDATGGQLDFSNPGGGNSSITFTATTTGLHYVGISGNANTTYDPLVAPSGVSGTSGTYFLDVLVNAFPTDIQGNRINMIGPDTLVVSNSSPVVVDGAPGVSPGNVQMVVNSSMAANVGGAGADVVGVVQTALRDTYAPGADLSVIKSYRDVVKIHSPVGVTRSIIDQGPLFLASRLYGDEFGAFSAGTNLDNSVNTANPGYQRGQNNAVEGVYIDDIIVGFAERGEMSTDPSGNANFISNPLAVASQINVGPYQLEIRRADQYGTSVPVFPFLRQFESFDTNDRFVQQQTLIAPSGDQVYDGQTFSISDGINSVTFEYENVDIGDGVTPGNFAIPFDSSAFDPVSGGINPTSSVVMAQRIRSAINGQQVQSLIDVTAALSDGRVSGVQSTSSRINLFGNATLDTAQSLAEATDSEIYDTTANAFITTIQPDGAATFVGRGGIGDIPNAPDPGIDRDMIRVQLDAGERLVVDVNAQSLGSPLDALLRIFDSNFMPVAFDDNFSGVDPFIDFVAPAAGIYFIGVSGAANNAYNPVLDPDSDPDSVSASTGFYEISLRRFGGADGIGAQTYNDFGDTNTFRAQGQLLIRQSTISNSGQFGVVADAGLRDRSDLVPLAGDELSHAGPVRVLEELNGERLVPGLTVTNNVIAFNGLGGIQFSGDPNAGTASQAPVAFGRLINNTIVGGVNGAAQGVGIQVSENASPTIMNNIFSRLAQGITVDGTSTTTVIGGSVYQANTANTVGAGLGDFPLIVPAAAPGDPDPLFVDPLNGNFYLAEGAVAIDSAIDSLEDRPSLVSVKDPAGIGLSPVKAPDRDITGQLRVDDTSVEPIFGFGNPPFRDRGAIDRADFAGPTTVLINPRDNDADDIDSNSAITFVSLSNVVLSNFRVQIVDGVEPSDPIDGIGVADATVNSDKVSLFQDGDRLEEGVDYSFSYDPTNNVVQLTPLAGIWESDANYVIELVNTDRHVISGLTGADFVDGDLFTITDTDGQTVTFEMDAGFQLLLPAIGVGVGGISEGQSFTIDDGAQLVRFEFDSNNTVQAGSIAVPFTAQSTLDQLADSVVAAVASANVGMNPINLGGGQVHLGGTINHVLNTAGTTATQTGTPGAQTPGAVPVPFAPSAVFDGEQLAASIVAAVNGSSLVDVTARQAGGDALIEGAVSINGIANTLVEAIKDLAGNDLKANRTDGFTRFTIFIGSGLDYGDAPDGPYQTLEASNGPRHPVVTGFFLGERVDSDIDGQPTSGADGDDFNGDDEDGLISLITGTTNGFIGGFIGQAEMVVQAAGITPTRQGFLDVFVDFNQDGDFLDPNEQVVSSFSLANGLNTLNATTVVGGFGEPSFVVAGQTVARFRLSSTGGLTSSGLAVDGEVEDHLVSIVGNPHQNQNNRFDVNDDGFVAPDDALAIVNLIISPQNPVGPLPIPPTAPFIPPPFYDVTGDGIVAPDDILAVINEIRRQIFAPPPPEGEGEGEGELIVAPLASTSGNSGTPVSPALSALAANQWIAAPAAGLPGEDSAGDGDTYFEWTWRSGQNVASATHAAQPRVAAAAPLSDLDLDDRQLALDDLLDDIAARSGDGANTEQARDDLFAKLEF